jgi:hypothetical protein
MSPRASSSTSSGSSSGSSSTEPSSDAGSTDSSSSSASDTSSASDEPATDSEETRAGAARHEARIGSLAAKHIKLEHLDRALSHVGKQVNKALESGRLTGEQLNGWSDDDWSRVFADVARDNPEIAVPLNKAKLPSVGKRRTSY